MYGKIFRKDRIQNIKFDEYNNFEDIEFATKSFLNSNKIVFYNEEIYINRERNNSRSKSFENDDRINACCKSWDIIPQNWRDNYVTYTLFNAISIVNMMILNNKYNHELLDQVQNLVKENIKTVKKSKYNIRKKMQIYIFAFNIQLYKKIYMKLKK